MDRSASMRAIRSKDMMPELVLRSLVYKLGCRFRLHRKGLPGKPDLAFASRRRVIFVHGCFWHSHSCKTAHVPKSNQNYWLPKLRRNQARDEKNVQLLASMGWDALTIWECETRDAVGVEKRVKAFLGNTGCVGKR